MSFDFSKHLHDKGWREALTREAKPDKHIERFQADVDTAQQAIVRLAKTWNETKARDVAALIWGLMHQLKRYKKGYKPLKLQELCMINQRNGGVERFMELLDEIVEHAKEVGLMPPTRWKSPYAVDEAYKSW